MGSVGASGSTTTMTFQLSSLLPPSSNPGFYFYEGSRQFPACSESYLVMVIEDSETMSKTQVKTSQIMVLASWSLLEPLGASWSLLEPPGASWSLLEPS